MALRFAYNTNGVSNHRFEDALGLIADSGYDGVALTLDHHHFDPFAPDFERRTEQLAARLERLGLGLVVETGARFLLDPRQKHEPTLITPDAQGRARRLEFLKRAVDVCATCRGEAVSFWAGVPRPGVTEQAAWPWLVDGVARLSEYAAAHGVVLAVEPEPGMLVETVDAWRRLQARVPGVRLALDVGHLLVTQERTPAEAVREFAQVLGTVALEDMKRGVHEHLPFGEGDVDVPSVLRELTRAGYDRLVCVELSRDAHRAHELVPRALEWLRERLPTGAEVAA
ncbi:sugar phosphate isomerase/epimerase [Corallococcus exercitus]|uniref:Sugar phosphate isomerase/epimerase n=1 Tax=Corallococcus exercitus TaxID=2316736 RepID=A0A3A8HTT1_9BACT|nr:sugar phosphate isomerase/epimerase family protein [Corallococcus exercitus]NOK37270.1 sugar phosphate isomerase/epimerase [Corallococcus exercitus]RKG73978.1 sugar phosphate isomerase/epimerase [Corallococcus exercitus]